MKYLKLEKLFNLVGEDQLSNLLGLTNKALKNRLKTVSAKFDQILTSIALPQIPKNSEFTFIDLFAGIGGLRRGFENVGGHCVFTSEWDKYSQRTYAANFDASRDLMQVIQKVLRSKKSLNVKVQT